MAVYGLALTSLAWSEGSNPATVLPEAAILAALPALSKIEPTPICMSTPNCDAASLIALGRALFFDPGIAPKSALACASCHNPQSGFGASPAVAERFRHLPRSIPSITNLRDQRWFFWDGRSERLWAQAIEPLESRREMNSHRLLAVRHLAEQPTLLSVYRRAWSGQSGIVDSAQQVLASLPNCSETVDCQALWASMLPAQQDLVNSVFAQLLQAIEAYELTLTTPPTRFDHYVQSVRASETTLISGLSLREREGMTLFFGQARCVTCHSGPSFSDGGFHNLFLPAPPGRPREDAGRFAGVQQLKQMASKAEPGLPSRIGDITPYLEIAADNWGQFKTPNLRNLGGRSEFMHNGVFKPLAEVLHYYNTLDSAIVIHHHTNALLEPLNLSDSQLLALEDFLKVISQPAKE